MKQESHVTPRTKQLELPAVRKQLLLFIANNEARRCEARRATLAALTAIRS